MPRGSKAKYTAKQIREADDIKKGYLKRGVSEDEAERRAWATVNKMYGGGAKGGSGSKRVINKEPARKGGRKGGAASARRPASARSASAKKAALTRKRNAAKS
jgi:plasmid stabilization system protein ParE